MTKKILRALAPWREVFCMVRLSVRRFTAKRHLPPGVPRGVEVGLGDLRAQRCYAPLVLRALEEHQVQLVGFEPCLDKTQQARRALALTLNLQQVRKLSEAIGHAKCVLPLA